MSPEEAIRRKGEGRTDRERLQREQGIEPKTDPDEGEFDWSNARVVTPSRKIVITMRLDKDVLTFFKSQGTRLPDTDQRRATLLHGIEEEPIVNSLSRRNRSKGKPGQCVHSVSSREISHRVVKTGLHWSELPFSPTV